jgi:CxxC motif-containing protein
MKKFYFFILFITLFHVSFSAPVINANSNGNWNTTSTWDLNRLPKVGDTVVIPSGTVVTINDDQSFTSFVFIKVYGKLIFQNNNSTLSVNAPSVIIVYTNAQIVGGGSASQKIRYNNSIIFDGDDNPVSGPQMASAVSFAFVPYFSAPLPLKFVGFSLTRRSNDILVQWSTSQEINANVYEVERSLDGNNWSTIAYFSAVGNTSATNNYSFTDKNVSPKVVYYRVKEVEAGGKAVYTTIKSLRSETTAISEINIAGISNKVLLQFPQEIKGNLAVRFVSKSGQVVDQQIINNPVGQVVLNSKFTGNYIIAVSNGQDINTAKQVIL